MSRPSVLKIKTFAAVLGVACACMAPAAEAEKEKHTAYMGMTRDQLLSKLGDPRNVMKAGPREILFFPHLKLTLRNGLVVETDAVFDDLPTASAAASNRRPAAEPAAPAAPAAMAPEPSELPGTKKTAPAAMPEAPAAKAGTPAAPPAEAPSVAAPSQSVEIKSVRPPTANAPRPAARPLATKAPETVPATMNSTASATPISATPSADGIAVFPTAPAPMPTVAATPAPPAGIPFAARVPVGTVVAQTAPVAEKLTETAETATDAQPTDAQKKKAAPKRSLFRRHTEGDDDLPEPAIFTARTYVFGAALIGAIAYLFWWRRQRGLELAATTVSSTPFDEKIPVDNSAMFDAAILAKLEWKRFEELVAAYYVKTGVVAVRTNTGPDSPVHLKISWKGESKPFAGVQCHPNPSGLIRSGPLQQLFEALNGADIRRGYVVTNGKFNVEARDLASEKHFTLISGDILIEKLNALPPAARAELMQEILKGDYTTPTCPRCDVKMVRADENLWRCVNHPRCEQTISPRKP